MTTGQVGKPDTFDVRSLSLVYHDGHAVPAHRHGWAQLIHARSGTMRVTAGNFVWFVPPTQAIWIPADTEHQFSVKGETAFRTLYVAPRRASAVGRGIAAIAVSEFLAVLILHIAALDMLDSAVPAHDRLAGVLVDLINDAAPIDLMLPLPRDARACRLADIFQARPDDIADLPVLAAEVGGSVRTLQRLFLAETGMSVDTWRQKARLIASTISLARGSSVTTAAFDCGYASPSAFIAAFKRQFLVTPRQFARRRAG